MTVQAAATRRRVEFYTDRENSVIEELRRLRTKEKSNGRIRVEERQRKARDESFPISISVETFRGWTIDLTIQPKFYSNRDSKRSSEWLANEILFNKTAYFFVLLFLIKCKYLILFYPLFFRIFCQIYLNSVKHAPVHLFVTL